MLTFIGLILAIVFVSLLVAGVAWCFFGLAGAVLRWTGRVIGEITAANRQRRRGGGEEDHDDAT
jgi:hypothetical protein